ncbi:MAG: (4Fe-4S)-binding protein [Chitinophagaceae bacterium]
MPKDTHHYTNNEVTVVWKPAVCIHSTICWKGLIDVFNPRERPWVKMNGANTGRIIEQVKQCPSGALSYFMNEAVAAQPEEPATGTETVKVIVSPDGPYLIQSECVIVHSDGREETRTEAVALCRCGASNNKPWCDGSHAPAGFRG